MSRPDSFETLRRLYNGGQIEIVDQATGLSRHRGLDIRLVSDKLGITVHFARLVGQAEGDWYECVSIRDAHFLPSGLDPRDGFYPSHTAGSVIMLIARGHPWCIEPPPINYGRSIDTLIRERDEPIILRVIRSSDHIKLVTARRADEAIPLDTREFLASIVRTTPDTLTVTAHRKPCIGIDDEYMAHVQFETPYGIEATTASTFWEAMQRLLGGRIISHA